MRKTAIFRNPLFLEHDPGYGHPESPDRLAAIYAALDAPNYLDHYLLPSFLPAGHELLALNHTVAHIKRVAATKGKIFETLDPDTHTSPRSYEAGCLAVGAVVKAIEMLAAGEIDNGFALVRPPGHHAERDRTSGFCLFNNVAVAAQYGLERLGMERILIIDWDIHHGNGTQHSFYDTDRVLYFSTHQYPYFPGTGALTETGAGKGEGFNMNVPLPGGQDDRAYAAIFRRLLCPVARQYKPDCIIVSAGFDIYFGDPLGTMGVTTNGFAYMTRMLVDLAAEICNGRLLLALEGGYNLSGLRDGVTACLSELLGEKGVEDVALGEIERGSSPLIALERAIEVAKKHWTI
jgi:acetoin utilization deacetylase AcuC-like enzyme